MDLATVIAQTRDSIKKKFDALTHSRRQESENLEKIFRPVTQPLQSIEKMQNLERLQHELSEIEVEEKNLDDKIYDQTLSEINPAKKTSHLKKLKEETTDLTNRYISDLFEGSKGNDVTYGPKVTRDRELVMGRSAMKFHPDDYLQFGKKKFKISPGLYELIFKKKPENYSQADIAAYMQILDLTKAAYRENTNKLKYTKAWKYMNIIKPNMTEYMKKKSEKSTDQDSMYRSFASVDPAKHSSPQIEQPRRSSDSLSEFDPGRIQIQIRPILHRATPPPPT